MNVKKKIIYVGLAVAMLLTACTSKDTEKNSLNIESNNSKISLDYSASASYTDNYLMYFSDSNIMEYYDIESGYETTVCSKANCKHQGICRIQYVPQQYRHCHLCRICLAN